MKIEILPSPKSTKAFSILVIHKRGESVKREAKEIQRSVMTYLIEHGYTPKQTQVESVKDKIGIGAYSFDLVIKEEEEGSRLCAAIKQALELKKGG